MAIGAGDNTALQHFFAAAPSDRGACYLVLNPTHPLDQLAARLGGVTSLPICTAGQATRLTPGQIILIPPGQAVAAVLPPSTGLSDPSDPGDSSGPREPGEFAAWTLALVAAAPTATPLDAALRTLAVLGPALFAVILPPTDDPAPAIATDIADIADITDTTDTTDDIAITDVIDAATARALDGILGLAAVRSTGGLTAALGATASNSPVSNLFAAAADITIPIEQIAQQLGRRLPYLAAPPRRSASIYSATKRAVALIARDTTLDLAAYAPSFLWAHLDRRRRLLAFDEMEHYLRHLESHPAEASALLHDILARPPYFFADPLVVAALTTVVIPQIFQGKQGSDQVRVWVPGCAAGEEAYTVAILLLEYMASLADPPDLRLFATDLNPEALRHARAGLYLPSAFVPADLARVRQFFSPDGYWLRIAPTVRQHVVVAQHHPLKDPAFSKLDLIVCRGLFASLQPDAVAQLAASYHLALKPDGYLCLAGGETLVGPLWRRLAPDLPLYYRAAAHPAWPHSSRATWHSPSLPSGSQPASPPALPPGSPPTVSPNLPPESLPASAPASAPESPLADLFAAARAAYLPPGILVDERYTIVYYSDGVSPYLHQPDGLSTDDVLARILPPLREHLAAAVIAALKLGETTASPPIPLRPDATSPAQLAVNPAGDAPADPPADPPAGHASPPYVRLIVQPVPNPGSNVGSHPPAPPLALVLFTPVAGAAAQPGAPTSPGAPAQTGATDAVIHRLHRDLAEMQRQLQLVTDEYTTMNAELKAANEELLSLNEEMQVKAAELQRSKEDLQAANQELLAINAENQHNIAELRRISANLQNLLVATDIATLFLDRELHIRWFTPGLARLFNILAEDLGRPLHHFTHHLHFADLHALAAEVLATTIPAELEVAAAEDAWYFMRVLPYRTVDGQVDGVVMTWFDITPRRRAENALRALNLQLELRVEERTLELARSNRELDQFAYVASHDLKAPLRAVTNLADWISADAGPVLPPASKEHLHKLRARITRMETLLDDLLTYSRAGRHLHPPEWVDSADLLRGIQFFLVLPPGFRLQLEHPLPRIYTERVPLETVLRNLLANAVKHHDRPAEGFVRISAAEMGDWVEFTVLDNGPGIAPEHHERIFQIFQSLKSRDKVEGSGMGLAVVKKTIESHGGRIEVDSALGQGATFRFTWPKQSSDRTDYTDPRAALGGR